MISTEWMSMESNLIMFLHNLLKTCFVQLRKVQDLGDLEVVFDISPSQARVEECPEKTMD